MSTRFVELRSNLEKVHERIELAAKRSERNSKDIKLIVVTKTYPVSDIEILYELGVRNFGENRDQEGSKKAPALPADTIWHFQGQIQSNKLKSIAKWANLIHSLDEIRHAKTLDALSPGKEVLIQVSLDELNENRGGVRPESLQEFLETFIAETKLSLLGFMAVAPLNQSPNLAFSRLREILQPYSKYPVISAGMSNDFEEAILQGATHLRIGSEILGVRPPLI